MSTNIMRAESADVGDAQWISDQSNHHPSPTPPNPGMRSSSSVSADYFQNEDYAGQMRSSGGAISEIDEIEEEEYSSHDKLFEINTDSNNYNSNNGLPPLDSIREEAEVEVEGSLFSFDFHNGDQEAVYVAVGKSSEESSSMDALLWTLNNIVAVKPSTVVFLVHVFPEIKFIPMPLGMIPVSQVNPEQKENYMVQERGKRRDLFQKFLGVCSASKVKVDTILIESDMEAKAILDLIPILNIRKLVLGTTKANLRRMRTRRGTGIADQIKKGAPEFCEVKIICEGKEIMDLISDSPSPRAYNDSPESNQNQHQPNNDSFTCGCFVKPKVIS